METLPQEIWDNILEYCSIDTWKSLFFVSRSFSDIVSPHLFSTISCFGDSYDTAERVNEHYFVFAARRPGPDSFLSTDSGIVINGSARIDLVVTKPQWQAHLRHVFFGWLNGNASERLEAAINHVSKIDKLRDLHVSLPIHNPPLHFDTSKITSVTTYVPIDKLGRKPPDFGALFAIFQFPSLRRVFIDSMRRLDCDIPEKYHRPGISNVKSLIFLHSGYPSRKMKPILAWPRDLLQLVIDPSNAVGLSEGEYENHTELFDALSPLKKSLQSFDCILGDDRTWERAEGAALFEFHALKHLTINLQMLMDNSERCENGTGMDEPFEISAPPIHTRLPRGLEVLELDLFQDLISQNFIPANGIQTNPEMSILEAEEIFEWLSGLVHYRDKHFPNMRRVVLSHGHWDTKLPCGQNCACPLYYNFTSRAQKLFADAGIALVFSDNPESVGTWWRTSLSMKY